MQINHCLIMAAGFGTRMGEIGKKLPKIIWPAFEKSILELQVGYAKSLGIENIYINLHYMSDEIQAFCKDKSIFEGVKFLIEKPEILDIGGAVHNVAAQKEVGYKGRLLILNADQFYFLTKEDFTKILAPYKTSPFVIFNYLVNWNDGYNALEMDSKRVVKSIIDKSTLKEGPKVETYNGISLIDLSKLEKITGPSKFFESVCNFKKNEVIGILLDNVTYWDFGTVNRYWNTNYLILKTYRENANHPFIRFLVNQKALKTWKINLQTGSYNSSTPGLINLNADPITGDAKAPQIVMKGMARQSEGKNKIVWNEMEEVVKPL